MDPPDKNGQTALINVLQGSVSRIFNHKVKKLSCSLIETVIACPSGVGV
jgi:hypothetical protein